MKEKLKFKDISLKIFSAYLRFEVIDKPGVLSNITQVFSKKIFLLRLIQILIKIKDHPQ